MECFLERSTINLKKDFFKSEQTYNLSSVVFHSYSIRKQDLNEKSTFRIRVTDSSHLLIGDPGIRGFFSHSPSPHPSLRYILIQFYRVYSGISKCLIAYLKWEVADVSKQKCNSSSSVIMQNITLN